MSRPALTVEKLSVVLRVQGGLATVVDEVSFSLRQGEVLALVGESGSGKTKTAEAIMGLGDPVICGVSAECLRLGDTDLYGLPEPRMRRIRGRDISMVFQEPATALDPVFSNGKQLCDVFRRHRKQSGRTARRSASSMLERVGFADPERIMHLYPHQLSGGMQQRIMIAMAMACRPRVLIADEPTSSLDVTTQAQVLSQLIRLGGEAGTAILLITHDLGVVAQYCDRAIVMRRGKIVEDSGVDELFAHPVHPYTQSLLAAVPSLED